MTCPGDDLDACTNAVPCASCPHFAAICPHCAHPDAAHIPDPPCCDCATPRPTDDEGDE